MKKCIVLLMAIMFLGGCLFTHTVYVPPGQAVRLRRKIKNQPIWVRTKEGKMLPSKMDIPEGWYCLSSEN